LKQIQLRATFKHSTYYLIINKLRLFDYQSTNPNIFTIRQAIFDCHPSCERIHSAGTDFLNLIHFSVVNHIPESR
jgi:hypothetical protein